MENLFNKINLMLEDPWWQVRALAAQNCCSFLPFFLNYLLEKGKQLDQQNSGSTISKDALIDEIHERNQSVPEF
jgi:hypothetical protein